MVCTDSLIGHAEVMMTQGSGKNSQAVLFFDGVKIVKEMLYGEFEAILDDVAGLPEFASQTVPAVFVKVNPQLLVVAAVFFDIGFDEQGLVERNWNIPLGHMSEIAGRGPDMGAGPIRLACRSQCPVSWHQRHLWDPVMGPEGNSFAAIKHCVTRNRLCLIEEERHQTNYHVEPPILQPPILQPMYSEPLSVVPTVPPILQERADVFEREERLKAAQLIKRLRLQLTTAETRFREMLSVQRSEYVTELESYQEKLKQLQKGVTVERKRNQALKEKLAEQAAQYQLAREQLMDQMEEAKELEHSQLEMLKLKFEQELQAKLESESADMKEMLEMREVELYYRDEQIAGLREEVALLRQEKQRLLLDGGDQFLEKLRQCGITFVAYHPGAGHLTIPWGDAGRYLESPTAYVAEKCFVTQERYLEWLEHYQDPCCSGKKPDGKRCEIDVKRAESPGHYIPGKSDRCQIHAITAANFDDQILKIS